MSSNEFKARWVYGWIFVFYFGWMGVVHRDCLALFMCVSINLWEALTWANRLALETPIQHIEKIYLNAEQWNQLIEMLERPARPNEKLRKLMQEPSVLEKPQ